MKYDFTTILERKGHDAIAYDGVGKNKWGIEPKPPKDGYEFIPMWVADMCFATAPSVVSAMKRRLEHPTFGYFEASKEYYEAIIKWHKSRYGIADLSALEIGYENGMHGLINSVIEAFSKKGDAILLHSPYYVAFLGDIKHKQRKCVCSQLYQDEAGIYRMDYKDMDRKIKEHNIHLAILCSPHNPTGRVWTKEELEQAMQVFEKNDCYVISDEIWADIIYKGSRHIPTQSVNAWAKEHVIAGYAPSKTFNMAGLIGSYHVIYNETLRNQLRRYEASLSYNEMNVMSMHALIGAYSTEGEKWRQELLEVLEENCRYAYDFVQMNLKGVKTKMPQGTYMLFLDCTEYCIGSGKTLDQVICDGWEVGIGWEDGRLFGGACHIRLNLALPHALEVEAFNRMRELVFV
ncbi:MalY/PatB family protein [Eubacterium oxidoreducens]|uniref:cysteine-S-conjugate beta-lyase n=1 Tax=Eubacterium oxidoreducens TaxID=1732 RepID=A0A1G6BNC6_EUBOX|nr:aminotransferase class I/II-fold pyridoxal phosphate-dependent enzyme [Eubacterium oxidoreducens]SDB22150.1 cystathione beta-lyase [Eubacterium oxidoreducens]